MTAPHPTFIVRSAAVAMVCAAAWGLSAVAGPVDPPAGPVQPSGKTLTEIEPRTALSSANTPGGTYSIYKISQPGSYYLTGDVNGVVGKNGIEITSGNVKLDLNGFTVRGIQGASAGIVVTSSNGGMIEVCNGSVYGWSGIGIALHYYNPELVTVRNVHAVNNGADGIMAGSKARIVDCVAKNNGGNGIVAYEGTQLSGCTAENNSGDGISCGSRSVIEKCVSLINGARGIVTGDGSVVTACTSNSNTQTGLQAGATSRVSGCTSTSNNTYGYFVERDCLVTECIARSNATGAVRCTGSATVVSRCTLEGVSGFATVQIDNATGVRINDNTLTGGTYAVAGTSSISALVTGNLCISQTSGAFNLSASAQVGGAVTASGTIGAVSPFANFVH